MKILVATSAGQGLRQSDFNTATDGTPVRFADECDRDRDRIDGRCGCRRAFATLTDGQATTTARIAETDMARDDYVTALTSSYGSLAEYAEPGEMDEEANELLRIAEAFPIGTVVEKRGNQIKTRPTADVA